MNTAWNRPFLAFLKKEDFVRGNDSKKDEKMGVDSSMTGWISASASTEFAETGYIHYFFRSLLPVLKKER
ncbi:MAG: hypothetical protein ACRER2_13445 [Methylococcales bacterium]